MSPYVRGTTCRPSVQNSWCPRNSYRDTVTALGDRLPLLSEDLPPIELVYVANDRAECHIFREETILGEQKMVGYPVYFIKENGIWKLLNF